jgi:sugar phosphate isomerase/epimerase
MLIGTMNHPARPVVDEIKWMAEMGLDFIDLTLEPPNSAVWRINPKEILHALRDHNMQVIGHTAYYLPLTSPFESIRRAAIDELKHCLEAFAIVGVKWMNIHPGRKPPLHDWKFTVEQNLRTLRDIIPAAQQHGIGLMIENLPGEFNSTRELAELLDPLPELGLHLDIGHAQLMVERNTADDILAAYGKRLKHVHLHDNKGGSADLHLPLGTGLVDTAHYVRSLQSIGYDGTITLEVFTPDRHYLKHSRDVLRRLWDAETKGVTQPRTPVAANP